MRFRGFTLPVAATVLAFILAVDARSASAQVAAVTGPVHPLVTCCQPTAARGAPFDGSGASGFTMAPARQSTRGAGAFLAEFAGGTLGSAIGFGLGVLITDPDECNSDDLLCYLESVGIALAISGGTAGLGAVLAGRIAETDPSVAGAFVGSAVGIAAGVGVVHLISEELDLSRDDAVLWAGYTVTQGIVTALGSRLFTALRE